MIETLLSQLMENDKKQSLVKVYPGTESDDAAISRWEKENGFLFPSDYRQYLRSVGQCKLHGARYESESSFSVEIFSLKEVCLFSRIALGTDDWPGVPHSWYAIADAQDGNFIVMDLATVSGSAVKIIDGCAEYVPDLAIIAQSFEEFLACSMSDPDTSSGGGDVEMGTRYWSKPGHYYGQT